jgi:predicted rRNA methylase YqxC with S4 and FtsJ domains
MSDKELNKYEYIKQSGYISDMGLTEQQQMFFKNYVDKKGWDISNLTNEQIKEIKNQKSYKNPGMIFG